MFTCINSRLSLLPQHTACFRARDQNQSLVCRVSARSIKCKGQEQTYPVGVSLLSRFIPETSDCLWTRSKTTCTLTPRPTILASKQPTCIRHQPSVAHICTASLRQAQHLSASSYIRRILQGLRHAIKTPKRRHVGPRCTTSQTSTPLLPIVNTNNSQEPRHWRPSYV